MIAGIPYIASMALVLAGLYACIFRRNLIKVIIGVGLIESGVNMFLITVGFRGFGSIAPIWTNSPSADASTMSLPVPQALTLTSIVIGVAVMALMLSFAVAYYKRTETLDTRKGVLKE